MSMVWVQFPPCVPLRKKNPMTSSVVKNQRVLLLNASWESIKIISLQRAIVLLVEDKAESIETEEGRFIRSPSITLPMPSVIRLKNYVSVPKKKKHIPISRRAILNRDNKECTYCGKAADTIDHIHPRSKGGQHTWLNVIAACKRCNSRKGNKLLSDLGWKLRYQPIDPDESMWSVAAITDPKWYQYINYDK